MRQDAPIPILGAGIAGLATALSLAKAGFGSELFERAERLEEAGAGLQLTPNALRVLGRLGLAEEVRSVAMPAGTVRLRAARSGRVLAAVPVRGDDGVEALVLHRADLQRVLLDAARADPRIQLTLGTTLETIRVGSPGATLGLHRTAGGERFERSAPLAIAADGVHSQAAKLLGMPPSRFTGATAHRFVHEHPNPQPRSGIEAWLATRRHVITYPLRGGSATNVVLIAPSREDGGERDGDALLREFRGWHPELLALVRGGTAKGSWPLLEAPADRPMTAGGSVALVGDAAHALPPYAAQGAAMAIEDACVLAHCLAKGESTAAALGCYEELRRPRLAKVRSRVRFNAFAYHLPMPFALGRDLVLALRSPERLRTDLGWLHDWKPPATGA